MSLAEVAHRVRERRRVARVDVDAPAPLAIWPRPRFDFAAFLDLYPATPRAISEVEATLRNRQVHLLGRDLSLDEPNWNVDPDGQAWLDAPWTTVSYRNAHVDPKYVWEVHRLLYLLPLAALRSRISDPASAQDAIRDVLTHWSRSTRPNYGIAWTSGIEIALRLLTLTVLASDDALDLSPPILERIRVECSHGLHHLETFPSLYSSANNHRIAELACLLVVGASWGSPGAPQHESELAHVAASLFGHDGAPLEQSSTYGAVTLEMLGLALRFGAWRDTEARRGVQEVVDRGAGFLAEFIEPDIGILKYGDDDEWRILGCGLSEQSWLDCLSLLLDRTLVPSGPGLHVFAEGGLSVMRTTDGAALTFDHGPLGFGRLAAHGHLDQLHVSLYRDGLAWLVDPGTYEYHRSVEWRNHFRAAAAHNGPRVEGDPICQPTGPFNWSPRRPLTALVEATSRPSGARLIATSRSGTSANVSRREVHVANGEIRLRDQGPIGAITVSRFTLNPTCEIAGDATCVLLTHPRSQIEIEFRVRSGEFRISPEGGWVSTGYASKQLAPVIEVRSLSAGEHLDVSLLMRNITDRGNL